MADSTPRKVDVVFFDAGSGHRTAAEALVAAIRLRRPDWRVRSVDLLDILTGYPLYRWIQRAGVNHFNRMLRRDRVTDLRGLIRLCLNLHDRLTPGNIPRIAAFWAGTPPDVVLSVTPMNNVALGRALRAVNPRGVYATLPVDFEEALPGYWFNPGEGHRYLLGSERLVQQAAEAGIPPAAVHALSGMIAHPEAYGPSASPQDIRAATRRHGLDPDLPTVLVQFGGQGSVLVRDVARALAGSGPRVNLILMCGRNTRLAQGLRRWNSPVPTLVLGYVPSPLPYRELCTVLVGKPGTMTIAEAVVGERPLVAVRSAGMHPVQGGNETWLRRSGVGMVVEDAQAVPAALQRVLQELEAFRVQIRGHPTRGVFEVAELVERLTI